MTPNLESEIGALRRMAVVRMPSARIAKHRVRIKRALRRLGINPAANIPTWGLIGLILLPGVKTRAAIAKAEGEQP